MKYTITHFPDGTQHKIENIGWELYLFFKKPMYDLGVFIESSFSSDKYMVNLSLPWIQIAFDKIP